MKKLLLIFCFMLVVGCSNESKLMYHTITSDEAYNMISENQDIIILDVRSDYEYESGHIEGAINVPLDEIETFKDITDDKDVKVLVYCASGNRSKSASEKLVKLGYTEIYNFGGLDNWKYDIVTE